MNVKAAAKGITAIVVTIAVAGILISSMMGAPVAKNEPQTEEGLTAGLQKSVWDGSIDAVIADNGVFRIENAAQLAWLAASTNDGSMHSFAGLRIELVNDIDLDNREWTPIGNSSQPFSGMFEGNGHVISNIHCSNASSDYVGLFGYTDGSMIADLNIGKVDIVGNEYVAGLAGYLGSEASNITISGEEGSLDKIAGHRYVGGVAGYLGMNIDHAKVSYTDITGTRVHMGETYDYTDEGDDVGGIAGFANAAIDNSEVDDSMITAYRVAGGIVGNIQEGSSAASITNSTTNHVIVTIDHTGITDAVENNDTYAGKIYGRLTNATVSGNISIETDIVKINCGIETEAPVSGSVDEGHSDIDDDGVYVLDNVTIESADGPAIIIEAGHDITLIIKGTCTLTSVNSDAIRVPSTSSLTIKGFDDSSSLTVKGATVSGKGSGIGYADHQTGNITIIGLNELYASAGGLLSYGIGGVNSTVTIEDTHITSAIGGSNYTDRSLNSEIISQWGKDDATGGPAIGGRNIRIESSVIDEAVGGPKAAAIGALFHTATSISIVDSTIKAAYGGSSSAGIGGSRLMSGNNGLQPVHIFIENSAVTAVGGGYGAGIGSGYDTYCQRNQSECEIIIISYSVIDATGGKYAAGIGTGYHYANLSGYIDSTVDVSNVHANPTLKGGSYSEAQDIGYGVVDPSRDAKQITEDEGLTFTVAGELIANPFE